MTAHHDAAAWPRRRRGFHLPRIAAPLLVGVSSLMVFLYATVENPNRPGHFPGCPWLAVTGTYCPGCGATRMVHAIGHGHFAAAFGYNPLVFVALPLALGMWAVWLVRAARGRPGPNLPSHPAFIYGLLTVIIAFWIIRNLPFGSALAP